MHTAFIVLCCKSKQINCILGTAHFRFLDLSNTGAPESVQSYVKLSTPSRLGRDASLPPPQNVLNAPSFLNFTTMFAPLPLHFTRQIQLLNYKIIIIINVGSLSLTLLLCIWRGSQVYLFMYLFIYLFISKT